MNILRAKRTFNMKQKQFSSFLRVSSCQKLSQTQEWAFKLSKRDGIPLHKPKSFIIKNDIESIFK